MDRGVLRVSTNRNTRWRWSRKRDFWSMQSDFIYRHHIEPRVLNSICRKKKHSKVHWNTLTWPELLVQNWTCCKKNVLTIIGMLTWIEVYQIHGKWFTNFTLLKEKPPDGYKLSGRSLTKIQATTRPDHAWPEVWTKIGRAAQNREKQDWANEKPKLDNARKLRGIYFIDPEDDEYKETITKLKKNWKFGTKHLELQETEARSDEFSKIPKTKHACIVEAHESTRKRLESSLQKDHEDHIAGKG